MTLGEAPVVVVDAPPPATVLVVLLTTPVLVVTIVELPPITVEIVAVVGVTISVFSGTVLGRPLGLPVRIGGSIAPDVGIVSVKYVSVTSPVTVSGSIGVTSGVRLGGGLTLPLPTGMVDVNSGSGLKGGERSVDWAFVQAMIAAMINVVAAFILRSICYAEVWAMMSM